MAKYLILYNAIEPAKEFMTKSTPEQMKAGMDAWMQWKNELPPTIKFDFGMPLQVAHRIIPEGVVDSNNRASGYSIMEGDSQEEIVEALKTHPHLTRPGTSIDVLEMLAMP